MKYLIAILLLGCVYTASAQKQVHQNLEQSVHDNGKTLHITVNGTSGSHTVNYDKSFNVNGWSKAQKDALVKRITDSLGVHNPPAPPKPPVSPSGPVVGKNNTIDSKIDDNGKTLHLQFIGTQKSKSFHYDRTFNATGMSKQQKNALIKRVTDSLGISNSVQPSTN